MLMIQDVLISDDIVNESFFCDLKACKGACCTDGDYGAPVSKAEMQAIDLYKNEIIENLPQRSKEIVQNGGGFTFYEDAKIWGTSCHEDGACVFLTVDALGISKCGIEKTWNDGKIPFQKPISCHLYPIRIALNEIVGFEAWNYDRWEICAAACVKGNKEKMPLYRFVKDAIVRLKGEDFYEELDAAARYSDNTQ